MSTKKSKTPKKNSVVIEWPTTHFTIDDVEKKYTTPSGEKLIINITLRFRVKRALENKEIVTIGKIKPAIGRPKLVFAKVNPSKELLEAAKAAGVLPLPETKTSVPVAEVKTEKKTKTASPVVTPEAPVAPAALTATLPKS